MSPNNNDQLSVPCLTAGLRKGPEVDAHILLRVQAPRCRSRFCPGLRDLSGKPPSTSALGFIPGKTRGNAVSSIRWRLMAPASLSVSHELPSSLPISIPLMQGKIGKEGQGISGCPPTTHRAHSLLPAESSRGGVVLSCKQGEDPGGHMSPGS